MFLDVLLSVIKNRNLELEHKSSINNLKDLDFDLLTLLICGSEVMMVLEIFQV